jgi:two-component system chemotaxis response regulator CheB
LAIVQDPATAVEPSMPRHALASVDVDHCLDVPGIARLLHALVARPAQTPAARAAPRELVRENALFEGNLEIGDTMKTLSEIGTPSAMTCPECGGGLWELKDTQPLRYRCHTGHGYTATSLDSAQHEFAEQSLWGSVRALREREMLLRRLAVVAEATGDRPQAVAGRTEADRVRAQALQLESMLEQSQEAESTPE